MKKNPQFDLKDTAAHIGAAAAGAFIGVFVPRLALLGGLAAITGGVYYGVTEMVAAGGGMMSGLTLSGGNSTGARLVAEDKKFFDQAKDNANELIEGFKYGLFLDKIYKKDETATTTALKGLGNPDWELLQLLEEQNRGYQMQDTQAVNGVGAVSIDSLAMSGVNVEALSGTGNRLNRSY